MISSHAGDDLAEIVSRSASRPHWKWLWIAAILALAAGGAWAWLSLRSRNGQTIDYLTRPVEIGRISQIVTASGNLEPTNQIVVGSELSGTVAEILVDTNDPVKKDQLLLRLDTAKLDQQTARSRASLLVAKARVSQTDATLAETRADLARHEELLELSGGKTPSRAAMETSRAAVARAEADLESAMAAVVGAEAEVGSFESDLGKALIRSPVDGVVLARSIEAGQTVAASFTAPTLFTIAEDLKKMRLIVAISEADIGRVEPGQSASFSVDAWPGRAYSANLKKVAFGASNLTAGGGGGGASSSGVVTYNTELEVDNEDLSLRPGMTATVDISIIDRKDIIVVPNAALRFDPEYAASIGKDDKDGDTTLVQSLTPGGGRRWWRGAGPPKPGSRDTTPRVWILENGAPALIHVETGITDGRVTEILDDSLDPGTEVIVSAKPAAKS